MSAKVELKTGSIPDAARFEEGGEVMDMDDERLMEMGYKPELHRQFGLMSLVALGFSVSVGFCSAVGKKDLTCHKLNLSLISENCSVDIIPIAF